jgi:hypothetical protein
MDTIIEGIAAQIATMNGADRDEMAAATVALVAHAQCKARLGVLTRGVVDAVDGALAADAEVWSF